VVGGRRGRAQRGRDFADYGFKIIGQVSAPPETEQEKLRTSLASYSGWQFGQEYLSGKMTFSASAWSHSGAAERIASPPIQVQTPAATSRTIIGEHAAEHGERPAGMRLRTSLAGRCSATPALRRSGMIRCDEQLRFQSFPVAVSRARERAFGAHVTHDAGETPPGLSYRLSGDG
jgi:hypothetical protein